MIKNTPEQLMHYKAEYLAKCKPYNDALAKLQEVKNYKLKVSLDGEVIHEMEPDSEVEAYYKKQLNDIKQEYSFLFREGK